MHGEIFSLFEKKKPQLSVSDRASKSLRPAPGFVWAMPLEQKKEFEMAEHGWGTIIASASWMALQQSAPIVIWNH